MAGLLAKLSGKLGDFSTELGRIKGAKANKDILEAAVAGCVIVGAADGNFSDGEVDATIDLVANSKFIEATGFSTSQISDVTRNFGGYRPTSRSGRERLLEEIREAGKRPETEPFKKAIFLTWVDIADSDGNIDDKEKAALVMAGEALGFREAASLIE